MSSSPSGPGKTAPKIFQDFLVFDPLNSGPNASVLPDHTPPAGEGPLLAPRIGSCKHEYTTKTNQSVPPPLDQRPDGATKYKLATVCKKCRIHADVKVDYTRASNSCPNAECPLHHFQRLKAADEIGVARLKYVWQCSEPQCQAVLEVVYRQARIPDKEAKDTLINTENLKRRYEAVVRSDPSREGIRQATPMDALSRLRKYTKDALNPAHDRPSFPANNKRFMEAFGVYGQDCKVLLERLGFKYADDSWTLPNPPQLSDRSQADGSSQRELLEDVEAELLAWMYKISSETGAINPAAAEGWPSADRDVERTLAAQGYPRHVSHRRSGTSNEQLVYFASLGALPDFADSLIEFAYDRQSLCDPEKISYYFECLQIITQSRGTEQLQMKVATLESQDIVSRRDLSAAYRYLNIQPGDAKELSDERVVQLFQAQQPDLGATAAEEARRALYKIGSFRHSQLLINASRQSVDTYEDALSWLGNDAKEDTSDDTILALLAVKISDNKANEEIGQKAIATIARERKSNMLNNWLLTGRTDGYTMDVNEALRYLNIDQAIGDVDQTVLPVLFESARNDRPGDTTEKAITAIQQHLTGKTSSASRSPETWPVGLTSHGNTCYLNSLLQYYFSIKPLRDIVLDYDKYKLDTSACTEKQERVGQRKISMVEIKGGQRFAEDLMHLFQRMIKDPGPAVKPEEDLVCRAFLEPKDYALLASAAYEQAPNGLENAVDEKLTDAPDGQDAATASAAADTRHESNASSATLQGIMNGEDGDVQMTNDEKPLTPPTTPDQKPGDSGQPPDQKPPLPPRDPPRSRRTSTTVKEQALAEAKRNATLQQDVTEVHDGIMFRLRSGMMPSGVDESEEQKDPLRDLYLIGMTERHIDNNVEGKPISGTDSSITLNIPTENTNIYAGLDQIFDLQPYGNKPGVEIYKSVRDLPPLLQISTPRIDFDKVTGSTYKSDKLVRLEDELYMDRYVDTSHPEVPERRRRCWGWRKQLQQLKEEQKALVHTGVDQLDGPTAVSETAQYLGGFAQANDMLRDVGMDEIELNPDLPPRLTTEAREQAKRLESLKIEMESIQSMVDSQFEDLKNLKYRLAAVFIHRGSSGAGHYWVYIHDFANNIWRQYNDERVDEVTNLEDIFEAKTWNQGTPTYAVYVRDDMKDQLVRPVCREPEKAPSPEPVQWNNPTDDVAMKDSSSGTVDPKMVEEGGQASWDQPRSVAHAKCFRTVEWGREQLDAAETLFNALLAPYYTSAGVQYAKDRGRSPKRRCSGGDDLPPHKLVRYSVPPISKLEVDDHKDSLSPINDLDMDDDGGAASYIEDYLQEDVD